MRRFIYICLSAMVLGAVHVSAAPVSTDTCGGTYVTFRPNTGTGAGGGSFTEGRVAGVALDFYLKATDGRLPNLHVNFSSLKLATGGVMKCVRIPLPSILSEAFPTQGAAYTARLDLTAKLLTQAMALNYNVEASYDQENVMASLVIAKP